MNGIHGLVPIGVAAVLLVLAVVSGVIPSAADTHFEQAALLRLEQRHEEARLRRALRVHRALHGELPEGLEALSEAVGAEDRYRYAREGETFTLLPLLPR